jgi:FixJ family two-component response regulator
MTLAHALVYVIDVKRALERSSEQWLQRSQRKEVRDRLATLTPRDAQRRNCRRAEQTNRFTTRHNRGDVMEKMGATSVAELVILAQRAGIAPKSTDATKV